MFKAPTNNNSSSLNNNNNNPFLGDLQKKLFAPKQPDAESVGNPEIDDIDGISDDEDDEIEIKSDSPTIRVSYNFAWINKLNSKLIAKKLPKKKAYSLLFYYGSRYQSK